MDVIDTMKYLVEQRMFGVCNKLGDKLNMPAKSIRLFFIYASCMTAGSPVIVYMILAFWMKMRNYIHGKRNPIWDF